jgi:hypothetical protein
MRYSGVNRRCVMRVATQVAVAAVLVLAWLSGAGVALAGGAVGPTPLEEHRTGPSVGEYLTPDGTLDLEALRSSGYEGALDPEGFVVRADGRRGLFAEPAQPSAAASDPDDMYWSEGFHVSGLSSGVWALAVYDDKLIAGGAFTTAGAAEANHIAAWDGTSWAPLGSGMNYDVRALTVYGSRLVAGGDFTTAGGVAANYIAVWDGSAWDSLGSRIDEGPVFALTVYDNNLIAGGDFGHASDIAAWDGSSWFELGGGVGGAEQVVEALTVYDGRLIAAGGFYESDGATINNIAAWDGSAWDSLGSGTNSEVYALTVYDGRLVAGGYFTTAGRVAANYIAVWDGSAWDSLGSGMNDNVYALTVYDSRLIAGGPFTTAGGDSAYRIAAWDGTTWAPLGSGMNSSARALTVCGDKLLAGGYFTAAGGAAANCVAAWDGTGWAPLGLGGMGANDHVDCLAVYGGRMIAGGSFTTAGEVVAHYIAAWDGTAWAPLGAGLNGNVYELAVYGDNLVAGGAFTTAGGVAANKVATWDGASWAPLGSGMNASVTDLAVYDSRLIAGGYFTTAGGVAANRIATWEGASWAPLGSGMDASVTALAVYDSKLIAGGYFTTAGGVAANHIAVWDGSAWDSLGSGMNNTVRALTVYDSRLVAGGYFTTAGGVAANRTAAWDGTSWAPLGSGMDASVTALTVYDSRLVAGGPFTTAGGYSAYRTAAWDGTAWAALGSGVNNEVDALAVYDNSLMVGGSFRVAGGKVSWYIGQWTKRYPNCWVGPTTIEIPEPVTLYASHDTSFVIANPGGATITGSVSEDCDHFSIVSGGGSYSLSDQETLTVVVRFEPTAVGEHTCVIETGVSLCSDVSLTGTAVSNCSVAPTSIVLTEPVVIYDSRDTSFVITNTGGGTLTGTVSEACDDFSIVSGGGSYSLAGGETLTVVVRYTPTAAGTDTCMIETGPSLCSDATVTGTCPQLWVESQQKISDTEGNFTGTLDDSDFFGYSVCSLGDLDGDGVEDLVVGASEDDDGGFQRGAAWVLFMNTDGTVRAHQKISDTQGGFSGILDDGDRFGWSVCSPGDLDGDGVEDLAVGAARDDDGHIDAGAVWVLFLNANGTVKAHQKVSHTAGGFTGNLSGSDSFGSSVCSPGSLDGDGIADLVVGAEWDDDGGGTNRGAVWVLFLNANGTVKAHQKISDTEVDFTGTLSIDDCFGCSVCSPGDLDGNGVEDLFVGASYDDDGGTDRGAVWALLLRADGTVDKYRKISDIASGFSGALDDYDHFGCSVCSRGDLDGDGLEDLVVGAFGDDDGGSDRGAVWVLLLDDVGAVNDYQKISDIAGGFTGTLDNADYFGWSVCSLGDLDADGGQDLVVGAQLDDDGGTGRGAAWVLFLGDEATAAVPEEPVAAVTTAVRSFPNPSREMTRITFSLEREEDVALTIYDVRGRLVRALANRRMGPGTFSEAWDGTDDRSGLVPSGIYFARLERGGRVSTAKISVVR